MTARPLLAITITLLYLLIGQPIPLCLAEWLQTMETGVYQDSSGKVRVIVATQSEAQGVFILSGPSIPVQLFNLEQVRPDKTQHLFVKFDATAQPPVYSELVINDRSFKISGNLTLNLDAHTSIGIDNNNPYLTVVSNQEGQRPSIIGFSGLNEVVRGAGLAATILAANQLNPDVAKVIQPYSVRDNALFVGDQNVGSARLGTFIKPETECLKASSAILSQAQMLAIRQVTSEDERGKLLEQSLKESKKNSPLKGYLVLKAEPSRAILLDIKNHTVAALSPLASSAAAQPVCVIAPLPMS